MTAPGVPAPVVIGMTGEAAELLVQAINVAFSVFTEAEQSTLSTTRAALREGIRLTLYSGCRP